MLIDTRAVVSVMSYTMYIKMGKSDAELIRTNMTINVVGGGEPIGVEGVASIEFTVGRKIVLAAFFIAEVQGNYNVILGHNWIHANHCVPCTLH